jgi:Protein of unknown function (DUF3237)
MEEPVEQIGGHMSEHGGLSGELVYQYVPQVTQVVEYGASADAVFSGRTPPPPEGARFDLYLEGPVIGPRLTGMVRGVDYLNFRADGRAELHIHAEITTDDGPKIALLATGLAIPEEGSSVFQLRENVVLTTSYLDYVWVNQIQLWAAGTVDIAKGEVDLKAYAV